MTRYALLLLAPALFAAEYTIDAAHSTVSFTVKHMLITNVRGSFGDVSGTVYYNPQNLAATKVDATIGVESVNTNQPKRDAHLKSADFFDVAKFPYMKFVSKKVTAAGQDKFQLNGDLTLHGVTKNVTLDVVSAGPEIKDPNGKIRAGASATTTINRKDFGLTWNRLMEGGGLTVSEEVKIELDLQFLRK